FRERSSSRSDERSPTAPRAMPAKRPNGVGREHILEKYFTSAVSTLAPRSEVASRSQCSRLSSRDGEARKSASRTAASASHSRSCERSSPGEPCQERSASSGRSDERTTKNPE